ncbi:MAG: hypothetical protein IT579_05020 [Verrucomicrobia subdivision 3 bacterium]|nr:hypothetical protein [Verrucomicrobiota bacterium]MCC6820075.1 hypothetical protein [Limisphaerales bacterium]
MSLINDALKRAKQTQLQRPPPTPPLQFRPVEPGQPNPVRTPLLFVGLALALILVIALGGLVVWFVAQKSANGLRVAARTTNEATAPVAEDAKVGLIATPKPASVIPVEPAPVSAPAGLPVATGTNALQVTKTVEPPKALATKLQGIAFHPIRPSAIVNGKTVLVGDRVDDFRVLVITRRSVTLASPGATNVLSLSE